MERAHLYKWQHRTCPKECDPLHSVSLQPPVMLTQLHKGAFQTCYAFSQSEPSDGIWSTWIFWNLPNTTSPTPGIYTTTEFQPQNRSPLDYDLTHGEKKQTVLPQLGASSKEDRASPAGCHHDCFVASGTAFPYTAGEHCLNWDLQSPQYSKIHFISKCSLDFYGSQSSYWKSWWYQPRLGTSTFISKYISSGIQKPWP